MWKGLERPDTEGLGSTYLSVDMNIFDPPTRPASATGASRAYTLGDAGFAERGSVEVE
jgi:arginase family enzyme